MKGHKCLAFLVFLLSIIIIVILEILCFFVLNVFNANLQLPHRKVYYLYYIVCMRIKVDGIQNENSPIMIYYFVFLWDFFPFWMWLFVRDFTQWQVESNHSAKKDLSHLNLLCNFFKFCWTLTSITNAMPKQRNVFTNNFLHSRKNIIFHGGNVKNEWANELCFVWHVTYNLGVTKQAKKMFFVIICFSCFNKYFGSSSL